MFFNLKIMTDPIIEEIKKIQLEISKSQRETDKQIDKL
jgi:hypothetical protein